jgi:hypothetical protein
MVEEDVLEGAEVNNAEVEIVDVDEATKES